MRTLVVAGIVCMGGETGMAATNLIPLPEPRAEGERSLESVIAERRSLRDYGASGLSQGEFGQLLWAAQGITSRQGLRSAPSAGALYPLEVFAVVGRVQGLDPGVYRYLPQQHALVLTRSGDLRLELARAALGQMWLAEAPVVAVLAADHARTARKYGTRAERYVALEAGHAGQNLLLQAQALGLGTVVVGAFDDHEVAGILGLDRGLVPLSLVPVGRAP